MIYPFPQLVDLTEDKSDLFQRILEAGKLDATHMHIELPDGFDLEGLPVEPVKLPMIGFGDLIAAIAKPIARGIDSIAGTNLENCGGCSQRQDWWNEKLPLR